VRAGGLRAEGSQLAATLAVDAMLGALHSHSSSVARSAEELRTQASSGGGARVRVAGVPSMAGRAPDPHSQPTSSTSPAAVSQATPVAGLIQASASAVKHAHNSARPCRMFMEVKLKTPEKVAALSFTNHYVAKVSVQQLAVTRDGESAWETLLAEHTLMPNPHYIDGGASRFVISFEGRWRLCSALRLYLTQPSPCWASEEVRLENVAIYDDTVDLDLLRETAHTAPKPGSSAAASPKGSRAPQSPQPAAEVVPRDFLFGAESNALEPTDPEARVEAMSGVWWALLRCERMAMLRTVMPSLYSSAVL